MTDFRSWRCSRGHVMSYPAQPTHCEYLNVRGEPCLDSTSIVLVSDWRWLASTRELQRDAFDWDWDKIRERDDYLDVVATSVMQNFTSAVTELGEALAEVGWKPWASRRFVNRDAFIEELVDVAHFLANMAVAVDCTDDEWEQRYQAKQQVNRRRQEDGYDGVTGKCPRCHRSYDGAGVTCRPAEIVGYDRDPMEDKNRPLELRPYCAEVGHYV